MKVIRTEEQELKVVRDKEGAPFELDIFNDTHEGKSYVSLTIISDDFIHSLRLRSHDEVNHTISLLTQSATKAFGQDYSKMDE